MLTDSPIHLVLYASQPYVRFACESELRYVWGGDPDDPEPEVHRTGDHQYRYTFDVGKATCAECLLTNLREGVKNRV